MAMVCEVCRGNQDQQLSRLARPLAQNIIARYASLHTTLRKTRSDMPARAAGYKELAKDASALQHQVDRRLAPGALLYTIARLTLAACSMAALSAKLQAPRATSTAEPAALTGALTTNR